MNAVFQEFFNFISNMTTTEKLLANNAMNLTDTNNDLQIALAAKDALIGKALSGDIVLSILPATDYVDSQAHQVNRTVTVTAKTAAGSTHTWLNAAYASKLSITDSLTPHYATIASTTITFVAGVATVVITLDDAKYLAAAYDTLTVSNLTILGYTVTGGTSVGTVV